MIESLIELVKGNRIEDILLTGFVDIEDGAAQFCPDYRFIFFKINSKYIEFESIHQFSKLRIKIIDAIAYDFEIDKDWIKANSSVSEIVLSDTMANGNDIEDIILYNLEEEMEEYLICDAIEMTLANGQVIFLDPSYYFGINIGGEEQKQMWKANLNENTKVSENHIKISDSNINNYPHVLISFIVEGRNLDLKELTEELGIIPIETRKMTDWPDSIKNHPDLPEELKPRCIWCICQEEELCKQIEQPICKIVAQIEGKEEKMIEFCKRDNLKMSLCIVIHAETMNLPEIALSFDMVSYFGKLNVNIGFDIYTY